MKTSPPLPRDKDAVGNELEHFIRSQFAIPQSDELFSRTVNLWEEGYVDSTGVVEVLAHIEQTWEITIPDDVLFDPDFTSISGMSRLIADLDVSA